MATEAIVADCPQLTDEDVREALRYAAAAAAVDERELPLASAG